MHLEFSLFSLLDHREINRPPPRIQINSNKVATLRALQSQLGGLAELETIYLEGNPCQRTEGVNYRRKIMLALPRLRQIDATYSLYFPPGTPATLTDLFSPVPSVTALPSRSSIAPPTPRSRARALAPRHRSSTSPHCLCPILPTFVFVLVS